MEKRNSNPQTRRKLLKTRIRCHWRPEKCRKVEKCHDGFKHPGSSQSTAKTAWYLRVHHVASNQTEEQQRNKARTSLKWVSQLPHRWQAKAAFAKATGLATAAATTYCRLPPLKAIHSLSMAITKCYGNGCNSNLFRLLAGHSADPHFRIGATAAQQTLRMAASSQHFRNWWQTRQSYGPLGLTNKWLARQGWQHTNLPWTWSHPLIQVVLTADPSTTKQKAAVAAAAAALTRFELHKVGDPSALGHHLREGWRAQRWAGFLRSNTRAAAALAPHYGSWPSVADRAKEASRAWNYVRLDLQAHVRAITADQYISHNYDFEAIEDYLNNPVHFAELHTPTVHMNGLVWL